jgi:hypothetical protein
MFIAGKLAAVEGGLTRVGLFMLCPGIHLCD